MSRSVRQSSSFLLSILVSALLLLAGGKIVALADDPCTNCAGTYDAWVQADDEYRQMQDSTSYQYYVAAVTKYIYCLNQGCFTGGDPDSEAEQDPCLRGLQTCQWIWGGDERCLEKCVERYLACSAAYAEYEILDARYKECLDCLTRCDVPEALYQGTEEEYAAFKVRCDADYQSLCEGNPQHLLEQAIAARSKYMTLSSDTTCTASEIAVLDSDNDGVPDDVDACPGTSSGAVVDATGCPIGMQLSVSTDKGIYSPGETVAVTGRVSVANDGLADVAILITINPHGSAKTNASGNYSEQLTLPSDISEGKHTVTVTASKSGYLDVSQTTTITVGALLLTASANKPDGGIYVTNETIRIEGELTLGGEPVLWAPVTIKVFRADGTIDEQASITEGDGSYSIPYIVPKITLESTPPSLEEWDIVVIAEHTDGSNTIEASERITVNVLPVHLVLHHVQLVQVIDRVSCLPNSHYPEGELRVPNSAQPVFIADKQAGIRTVISCPSLEHLEGVSPFKVTVKLRSTGPIPLSQEKEVIIGGGELVSADFFFTLPAGTVSLWIQVDPDEQYVEASDDLKADITHVVVARPHKSLKLKFVAIDLPMSFSPDWATPMEREFFAWCDEQVRFMRQVYPLPPSRITYGIAVADPPQRAKASRLTLSLWLGNMAQQEGLALALQNVLLKNVGVLPDRWWGSGDDGCAFALAQRSACLVKYKSPLEGVTAHEVGHTLGLYILPGLEQYQQFREWGLPIVNNLVLKNGRLFNLLLEEEAMAAFPHPHAAAGTQAAKVYCFMGLGNDAHAAWVSREAYADLVNSLMDPPVTESLYVSGIISTRGGVQPGDWYLLEAEPDPPSEELPGDYTIQCLSALGEVLYTAEFGTDIEDVVFAFSIPFPADTSRVVIKHGETALHEVEKTPNSPTVSLLFPNGNEVLGESCEIRWRADDVDGDMLSYAVLYSGDGGKDWTAVATNLLEMQFTLPLSELPGGDQCLLKIVAMDGFNVGHDESDAFFSVADKTPFALITSHEDGDAYPAGEELLLQGIAYDLEDDSSTGLVSEWVSSLDGILGYGEELHIQDLSQGTHEIEFTVTDSQGTTAEERVSITIGGGAGLSNRPPTASFALMPQDPEAGDDIVVVCTSSDSDGDVLATSWYFDGEHLLELDNQSDWEWSDAEPGEFTILLRVEDEKGGIDEHSTTVEVRASGQESANHPPIASFALMPEDPAVGDPIVIVSTSSDPDGDLLIQTWYVDGEYEISAGDLSEWTWSSPGEGEYTIGLVVMDGEGGIAEYSETVTVVGDSAEDTRSSSSGMSSLLYLLFIPVAAAVTILVARMRRKR